MKKLILIVLVTLLPVTKVLAQTGEIIYKDFEPDLCVYALEDNYISDTINIDFDADGKNDLKMFIAFQSSVNAKAVYFVSSWRSRYMLENDTIIPSEGYWFPADYWKEIMFNPYNAMFTEETLGFRKEVDGHYYYAWAKVCIRREITISYPKIWAYFDKFAFCTIPDYPLQWGQTSLLGVEENNGSAFATIHPNPASTTITIIGENLKRIEITNMLGQRMATYQSEGSQATIDISALPTGIYFVGIIDESGKRCVQKVVKE